MPGFSSVMSILEFVSQPSSEHAPLPSVCVTFCRCACAIIGVASWGISCQNSCCFGCIVKCRWLFAGRIDSSSSYVCVEAYSHAGDYCYQCLTSELYYIQYNVYSSCATFLM